MKLEEEINFFRHHELLFFHASLNLYRSQTSSKHISTIQPKQDLHNLTFKFLNSFLPVMKKTESKHVKTSQLIHQTQRLMLICWWQWEKLDQKCSYYSLQSKFQRADFRLDLFEWLRMTRNFIRGKFVYKNFEFWSKLKWRLMEYLGRLFVF